MSWDSRRLRGVVWTMGGLRHAVDEWVHDSDDYMWESVCGFVETPCTTSGGKKPRVHKGFVTCLQCLAKGGGAP